MTYRPIIDLRIKHAYYADGRCADFAVEPHAATLRRLAGCRCVVQRFGDGLQVSAATGADGQVFAALPTDAPLGFDLRLQNADFALFTDLSDIQARPAARFTTVGADGPALKLAAVTASQTESFVFPAGATKAVFLLGGRPLAGAGAAQFALAGLDAGAAGARGTSERQVTVTAARGAAVRPFTVTYPVAPSLPPGVFAQVEIFPSSPPPAAGPSAYEVRFKQRAAKWRYYLVSPPAGTCAYSLDYGQTAAFALSAPDAADPVGHGFQAQFGAAARVDCFTSQAPLPYSATAPAGLRLLGGPEAVRLPAPRELGGVGSAPVFYCVVRT